MKRSCSKILFAAAIAAVSTVALPAFGQLRANQDGHAVDANNRVGSGGYNDSVGGGGSVNQGNIIYGNVTGLSGFTGPIRDFAAGQFEGPSPNVGFDNFVRTTAGTPTPYQSPTVANVPQAFYGSARNLTAPIGTERLGGGTGATGAYVGTNTTPSTNADPLLSQLTAALDQSKQSLGESAVLGSGTNLVQQNPYNGDQSLGGALDANNQATLYTLSPLFGVNSLPGSEGASDQLSVNSLFGPPSLAPGGAGRLRAQQSDIARMRAELLQQQNEQSDNQQSQNPNQNPGALDQNPLLNPLDTSLNPAQKVGGNSLAGNASISNSVNTQQGIQQRITGIVPGRQQNPTVKAYNERLNQYKSPQLRQLESYAKMANDRAAIQAKTAPGGMPTSQPAGGPIGTPGARGPLVPSLPPSVPNVPPTMKVDSLANGVQAKGLHDLLQSAEELMRQDKFQSAITKYNTAEDVAPNDALIPLGRANAELGAGYYNQASIDLHQVFESSPATLMGQYDLTKWMNDKRLDFIVSDLLALSKADKAQEMPEFLLAYLLYNSGRPAEAAEHLQKAKERAAGKDPLLGELESRWKLPGTSGGAKPSSDLNK
jgi:tetratricopeptide (TPR) repeat protein